MAGVERVTVTLREDLLRDIDCREKNRSKFVTEAVRHELDRRRRVELRRSLQNPHPESVELAEQGLDEWTRGLPEEDTEALVDHSAGTPVRWVPGEGWVEERDHPCDATTIRHIAQSGAPVFDCRCPCGQVPNLSAFTSSNSRP
jgi:hypothetical protein